LLLIIIAILKGNIILPLTVVFVKQAAVSEKMKVFAGKARIFNC
jgi:dihydroxyacid dehydratase/phosphogluconate dehydratase